MAEVSHRLANFDNALREARESVFRMASIAEQNLESAIRGLLTRNAELCNAAIVEDDEVNTLEKKIDADSFEILMRYNPVASDLREVIHAMRKRARCCAMGCGPTQKAIPIWRSLSMTASRRSTKPKAK